jgi:hypothetical protein
MPVERVAIYEAEGIEKYRGTPLEMDTDLSPSLESKAWGRILMN